VGRPRKQVEDLSATRRGRGRTEQAVTRSLTSRQREDRYAAIEALALAVGRAVDGAVADADPYAVAQLSPRLLELLAELRLTPGSIEGASDGVAELLAAISAPTVGDAP
jgi:hypothetical protein